MKYKSGEKYKIKVDGDWIEATAKTDPSRQLKKRFSLTKKEITIWIQKWKRQFYYKYKPINRPQK